MRGLIYIVLAGLAASGPGSANAGGLLGDLINNVAPGVGTQLDDVHRGIKNAIPPYKQIEEGASKTVNEALVQTAAPALQEAIARSRDDALRSGVQPIPSNIRQNLEGFIPENIINVARYRVRGGGDLSLQVNAIKYGEAAAITLDYVIVFASENDALYNPVLWVHELTHVSQFQRWGMRDFSIRYTRSYSSVEKEAYEAETKYLAFTAQNNMRTSSSQGPVTQASLNRPLSPFTGVDVSNVCGTFAGVCQVNGAAPPGTPCWCQGPMGIATGAIIPGVAHPPVTPVNMAAPPGTIMRACGCWGPNPVPFAQEPMCMSQQVHVSVCPVFCAPGHPAYGYVCN